MVATSSASIPAPAAPPRRHSSGVRVGAQFRAAWAARPKLVDPLGAMRGPGESYIDVILKLAAGDHERKRS